ncbi:phospholipase D [Tothia fuscella]|uniref:Phospholipase n=1 Tax=Tothia fuscella TaxID=1048955 RepID=A0A9P4U2Y2_9PEZI|nr:phospholipase D [Tothia fuscella]
MATHGAPNGQLHDERDSSLSPMTRSPVSPSSPVGLQRPITEHHDSQPRIASPLRMEQKPSGSIGTNTATNGSTSSPPPGKAVDLNKDSPAPTPSEEFPFAAAPGTSGQRPTNELVKSREPSPGEGADIPTALVNGNLSRKPTLEATGSSTPQGRRSVQFVRPSTFDVAEASDTKDQSGDNAEGTSKEKLGSQLLSKLKALASPMGLQSHGRSLSSWTLGGDAQYDDRSAPMSPQSENGEPPLFYEGDADAEESGNEALEMAGPSKHKKRNKFRRADTAGSASVPTTPKQSRMPHFRRDSSDRTPPASAPPTRPNFLPRRNTMSDIPENQRLAISEDEGRHARKNGALQRGSAWMSNHRGQSFVANNPFSGRHKSEDAGDPKRPRALRRITGFGSHESNASPSAWRTKGERAGSLSAAKWRSVRAGLKMLAVRRKEEFKIDHAKSGELMAELLAGAPAAIFVASMFQRDAHQKRRIPILLEQLKVKVTDTTDEGRYRIELEYASSLARMKWVVDRSGLELIKLHAKYKTTKFLHNNSQSERTTLPNFPNAIAKGLRSGLGIKGRRDLKELVDDNDEEDEEEIEVTAGEQSGVDGEASGTDRPGPAARRRSSMNFLRRKTTGLGGVMGEHGRTGSWTGVSSAVTRQQRKREKRRAKLEIYLNKMITFVMFHANCNRLCKFLELSALGVRLAPEGGYHGKEGYLTIKSSKGIDYRRQLRPDLIKARHTPKWFLVRHSYLVCVDSPEEMNIYEVILVDKEFGVEKKKTTRKRDEKPKELAIRAKDSARVRSHQIRIFNSERLYKMLARTREQQQQFTESINFMKNNTLWSREQRYDSFAPVRENVYCQFLVDGRDYMWNVSRAISMAKDVIYIHDWWLSPEIYLRRPAAISQKWRLDRLLKRKAEEGVKIYVIMYRNINSAIPIDSEYSKFSLLSLSDNVFVQRSPNQLRQNIFFWAHHEKICIIDHCVAFCGGVDLCFGRWDTPSHTVVDDRDTGFEPSNQPTDADHCQLWPGKDYSNPRVQDFYALDKPYEEMYDRNKIPRMPWHDIGMQIVGQPARDLSRHFVQRWNFVLRQRTPTRPTPFLIPPADFIPADIEALGLAGTCQVQILRSACTWSLGILNKAECSIMNAYVDMIKRSDHFIYIENQFFITSCEIGGTMIVNGIGDALVERIIRAYENDEDWRAVILIPLLPGFQNTVDAADGSSVRLIMQFQFRSICRGDTSIFERLRARGIEPEDFIHFYALRSWGQIGPNKTLVTEQLYIHAKCMIADDRVAIIGSANINERSMLGSRDSEVAAIVRDSDMIPSQMAGRDYKVGRFAHELRMRLMREHLGIDTDGCCEHDLEEQEEDKDDDDRGSITSTDSDRALEQHILTNQHKLQEDLIARQEKVHNFNHDVWAQQNNPNIFTNRKKTTDARVIGNAAHEKDVLGEGADKMLEAERLGKGIGRDTVMNARGEEVLVSDVAPEGKGSFANPGKGKARNRIFSPEPEPAPFPPPPPLERWNTISLGLPQISQLPELPVIDDTDIGGPPLQRPASAASTASMFPQFADMQDPVVTKDCMKDPVLDTFFLDTWHAIAENNTKIFRRVFRCMPDNEVLDWDDYKEYAAFSERFSQAQGAGKSKERTQQDTVGKSGPPGSAAVNTIVHAQEVVVEIGEKIIEKVPIPFVRGKDSGLVDGNIEDWAHDQEEAEQERVREESAGELDEKAAMRQADANALGKVDSTTDIQDFSTRDHLRRNIDSPADQESNSLNRQRTITITEPTKSQDPRAAYSPTSTAPGEANGNTSRATNTTGGGSQRKRRRATTRSSRRPDDSMLSPQEAEKLLNRVQGHVVLWPYDWLVKVADQWLYAVDNLAPWEIYT